MFSRRPFKSYVSRVSALEEQRHAQMDADATELIRLICRAHDRLCLADILTLGEAGDALTTDAQRAADARRVALCEESGAGALERRLKARYGAAWPTLEAHGDALRDGLIASAGAKIDAGEAHDLTPDERLVTGEGGAIQRLYARCTDAELDALVDADASTSAALTRDLAVKYELI